MYTLLSISFLEWTNWLSWNPCSVNCGYGTRLRHRLCKQCSTCVALDSKQCTGVSYEAEKCSSIPCSGKNVKCRDREIDLKSHMQEFLMV